MGSKVGRTLPRRRSRDGVKTGFCGICFRDLTADQPGGLNPRHMDDGSPYGSCRKQVDPRGNIPACQPKKTRLLF